MFQLMPKHFLGASDSMVCSTGNGCLTMIGWVDSLLMDHARDRRMNEAVGISFLPTKASWWSLKAIIVYGKIVYYSL